MFLRHLFREIEEENRELCKPIDRMFRFELLTRRLGKGGCSEEEDIETMVELRARAPVDRREPN